MRAWRLNAPGGPDAFTLEEVPVPVPTEDEVLVRIRAFGLNRAEHFTREGHSPSVKFPRTIGIECVGTVEAAPGGQVSVGQTVAAMMGGLGRAFDGSYAEYTCVPASIVFPLETKLEWPVLGALPEMLQTCHGSLTIGLGLERGQTLLVRGATSSIGLTSMAMARELGATVLATTRSESKRAMLEAHGAADVVVDDGDLAPRVRERYPEGVDRVLELIGATTLLDSLRCARRGGVVCMTGILGGAWTLERFEPMVDIPTGVRLTSYSGGASDIDVTELQRYVELVEAGKLAITRGPLWRFEQLVDAHRVMDANEANGKMVVVV